MRIRLAWRRRASARRLATVRELVPLGISEQAIVDDHNRPAVEALAGPVLSDVTVTFTKSGITLWKGGRAPDPAARIRWGDIEEFGAAGTRARITVAGRGSMEFAFQRAMPGRMNEHELGLLIARVRALRVSSPSS